MTTFTPGNSILPEYWDLLAFLYYTGWKLVDDKESQFLIFQGPDDSDNRPIEIVILRNPYAKEQPIYISNALEILSATEESPLDKLTYKIANVNQDELYIRLIDPGIKGSIPLSTAAIEIAEMKQLVAYAAVSEVSEDKPKPFYLSSYKPNVKQTLDTFQFGHTFHGSFGFVIKSPKLRQIYNVIQLSLLPEQVPDQNMSPISRRVMERIVRGFVFLNQAVERQNPEQLVRNYPTGFNANMCKSLTSMLLSRKVQIEVSVNWSPLLPPDDPDLSKVGPFYLRDNAYDHLEFATRQLMELQPTDVSIEGMVVELSARESPSVLDASRSIRVRWINEEEGKAYEAVATLELKDYQLAIEAHENWLPIEIKGQLRQKGNKFRFDSVSSFKILPKVI